MSEPIPAPRIPGARALLGVLIAACCVSRAAPAEPWHYTLDEQRAEQQANFCRARSEMFRLARVFSEEGPRPGFAALTQSPVCVRKVQSFTPTAVLTRVVIEEGEPGEYTVTFAEVVTAAGVTEFLVTTRRVAARP